MGKASVLVDSLLIHRVELRTSFLRGEEGQAISKYVLRIL